MSMILETKPGFDWARISWSLSEWPAAETCSYCRAPIPQDEIPLIVWRDEGQCARFCDACVANWIVLRMAPNPL